MNTDVIMIISTD